MAIMKLRTIYYIKVHDKNLPGDEGWKCEFEMNTARASDFLTKSDLAWIDQFVTYEKIYQEVQDEKGVHTALTKPIDIKKYRVENVNGNFCVKRIDEEKEMSF